MNTDEIRDVGNLAELYIHTYPFTVILCYLTSLYEKD